MKNTALFAATIAGTGLLAITALAAPLPSRLIALDDLNGSAYVTARDAYLAQLRDPDAAKELERAITECPWDSESWRYGVVAEAIASRIVDPDVDRAFDHLRGLDPQHYLHRRRPEPEVTRELTSARLPAAVLIERFLKTLDLLPPSDPSRFPPAVSPGLVAHHQREEREALATGLLVAIGRSGHRAAPFVLRDVVISASAPSIQRRVAATWLGASQAVLAGPALRVLTGSHDDGLVIAGLTGASRLHNEEGLAILLDSWNRSGALETRRAALLGLGGFASARAWVSHEHPGAPAIRQRAASALVTALRDGRITPEIESAYYQAIGAAAHPVTNEAIAKMADDTDQPSPAQTIAQRALRRLRLGERRR